MEGENAHRRLGTSVLQCREAKFPGTVDSVCCCNSLYCILDTIPLSENAYVA